MSKFKVGDKVRVVHGYENVPDKWTLERGRVYEVTDEDNGLVFLDGGMSKGYDSSRLELVTEPSPTFKVGDKVVYIGEDSPFYTHGKVYEVKEGRNLKDFHLNIPDDSGENLFWGDQGMSKCFELVSDQPSPQSLIDQANAGFAALRKLIELNAHFEAKLDDENDWYNFDLLQDYSVRLAKPILTLSTGWKVKVGGDSVHIGCKTFRKLTIEDALKGLLKHRTYEWGEFKATREGIISEYDYDNVLPWADAEKLLEFLKEAES